MTIAFFCLHDYTHHTYSFRIDGRCDKIKACFPLVTENSKQFLLVNGQTQCSNRLKGIW